MARKRVKLQRILNDAQRRATFKKRLKGLTKKATELATLCGVDMCLIVYAKGAVEATEVWPSVPEATSILERFKAMPDLDRYKRATNLEGFLKDEIDKLQKELHKVKSEADESETKLLLFEALDGRHPSFEGLSIEQLTNLAWMVDARQKIVNNRLEELRRHGLLPAPTPLLAMGKLPHDIVDNTNVEKPPNQQEGSLMDVGRSIDSLGHDGFGATSGSSTAGPNGDMLQVFSSGAGSSSANQGFLFPPK